MSLPEVTKTPCRECPWVRTALPGHLGPLTAEEWVEIAHSEEPVACHTTLKEDGWDQPGVRQCAGAAQYRKNVFKLPRDREIAVAEAADTETVFARGSEFIQHHS